MNVKGQFHLFERQQRLHQSIAEEPFDFAHADRARTGQNVPANRSTACAISRRPFLLYERETSDQPRRPRPQRWPRTRPLTAHFPAELPSGSELPGL